jgi:hypothetical protein
VTLLPYHLQYEAGKPLSIDYDSFHDEVEIPALLSEEDEEELLQPQPSPV